MLNERYRTTPNKALVSWSVVGQLLREAWALADRETVSVVIDRQGGRLYYEAALAEALGAADPGGARVQVHTEVEQPALCLYVAEAGARRMRITVRVEADRTSLVVAAASILAKYWRELLMARMAGYFAAHGCEARPTAGYYGDARRFLRETAQLRRALGIDDNELVRQR